MLWLCPFRVFGEEIITPAFLFFVGFGIPCAHYTLCGLCRFGLADFPDVSIAVAAADEAVDICRQELGARNPTAAKTAAEMAARAVAQMEVVVHRARERHEWELPQRHECAGALDGIDKALQVCVRVF